MEIIQLVHTLNYGDAISGEACTLARLLTEAGVRNAIYSVHTHEKLRGLSLDYRKLRSDLEGMREPVTLLLHYSIDSPLNRLFVEIEPARRVLLYHNLTPDHWYVGYNGRVVADLRKGRAELPQLLARCDFVLADSEFNRSELLEFGAKDVSVLPLPLDDERWNVAPNSGISRALQAHGGDNILHVGRLAPNKRIEDIIKAFYFYHHKMNDRSRLWLVGIDIDTEIYSFELRRLIAELRLKDSVSMVGAVADSELRAFYENSDLYICMSEHEGFCLPLLEAMFFGVPVIAFDACAVADTLGDSGILVAKKNPALLAELISIVLQDSSAREELARRGRERVKAFSLARFKATFESELFERLQGPSSGIIAAQAH